MVSRLTRDGTGEPRLARSNSQARTGTGKYSFSPVVQLTTSRIIISSLTRLIHTLLYVRIINNTYIPNSGAISRVVEQNTAAVCFNNISGFLI